MNTQQALQIINSVANLSAKNGGIFETIQDAASVNLAIVTLNNLARENEELKATIDRLSTTSRNVDSDEKTPENKY